MIQIEHLARSFVASAAPRGAGLRMPSFKRRAPTLVHAVRDVSLSAPDGHITGLLGPNGAGKTTTLRMLAGLITPSAGRMTVDGIDVGQQL